MDQQLLEAMRRIARLEEANEMFRRRLRMCGAAVAVMLVAVCCTAVSAPGDSKIIEARGFRVVDEAGRARALFGVEPASVALGLQGVVHLSMYDVRGMPRLSLGVDGIAESWLAFRDGSMQEMLLLKSEAVGGAALSVFDGNGQVRAVVGNTSSLYDKVPASAGGVVLLSDTGEVAFHAP